MWQSLSKVFVLTLVCISLPNCAQRQLKSQSNQFNRATAETASEHILLNAARASKDFPLLFTGLTNYTAGNRMNASASLGANLPGGAEAPFVYTFSPNFNYSYNPGVQSIQYGSLNTAQGLRGIKAPLTFEEIQVYYESSASVPWQLLVAVTTQVIQVTDEISMAVIEYSESHCSNNQDIRCRYVRRAASKCGWAQPFRYQDQMFVRYVNNPLRECNALSFQAFYLALTIAGFSSEVITTTEGGVNKKESRAYFADDYIQALFKDQQVLMKDVGVGPLVFKTRSPKGMIEYLGDIIKVENFIAKPYVPTILTTKGEVPIAIVESGHSLGKAVLRVRDDEGQVFSVPRPDYSSEGHLTLQAISIISDFYNSSIDKQALPEASSVIFTAN